MKWSSIHPFIFCCWVPEQGLSQLILGEGRVHQGPVPRSSRGRHTETNRLQSCDSWAVFSFLCDVFRLKEPTQTVVRQQWTTARGSEAESDKSRNDCCLFYIHHHTETQKTRWDGDDTAWGRLSEGNSMSRSITPQLTHTLGPRGGMLTATVR